MHPIERIQRLSKYNPDNGCWEWIGAIKGKKRIKQYGSLTIGSRIDKSRCTISAHRYSYMVFVGMIPDGLFVCHSCDNPKCVNPAHLFLGTRQQNVDDRESKNRNVIIFGENNRLAKFSNKTISELKRDILDGVKRGVILAKYKISPSSYKDIQKNRTWKRVLPSPPNK